MRTLRKATRPRGDVECLRPFGDRRTLATQKPPLTPEIMHNSNLIINYTTFCHPRHVGCCTHCAGQRKTSGAVSNFRFRPHPGGPSRRNGPVPRSSAAFWPACCAWPSWDCRRPTRERSHEAASAAKAATTPVSAKRGDVLILGVRAGSLPAGNFLAWQRARPCAHPGSGLRRRWALLAHRSAPRFRSGAASH